MIYMTVGEVAAKLRVDDSTVRGWIRSGMLVAIRAGRQYRIARDEYEAFIARREGPHEKMIHALAFAR
jgi:excisionase family DNA binding protein